MVPGHVQQPNLAVAVAGRQELIEVLQFAVERKRPRAADGDAADDRLAVQRDDVLVLIVETVDVPLIFIGRVLRDLFDERFVLQRMHLLYLARLARQPELDCGHKKIIRRKMRTFTAPPIRTTSESAFPR